MPILGYAQSPLSLAFNRPRASALLYDALTSAGLLAKYGFNEGSGTNVLDLSGVGSALDLAAQSGKTDIEWLTEQGIRNGGSGNLHLKSGAASKINSAIAASDEFTVELYFKPADTSSANFGRFLSIETGDGNAFSSNTAFNLTQSSFNNAGIFVEVALTNSGGSLAPVSQQFFGGMPGGTTSISRLYVCYSAASLKAYAGVVGGSLSEVYSYAPAGSGLSPGWGTSQSLNLFYSPSQADQWDGSIYLLAFYNQDHRGLLGF